MDSAPERMKVDMPNFASIAFRVFALLLLAALAFHENAGTPQEEEECSGGEASAAELSSTDYKLITSWSSYHEPNDQSVRIVTLSSKDEPEEILSNVCAQREFLAKLIRKLKDTEVSLLVLDKSYSESGCVSRPAATQKLLEAIAQGKSRVVVGLGTEFVPKPEQAMLGTRRTCLRVSPHVEFNGATYGLLRLDRDTRRVPLEWPAYQSSSKTPELIPSMALVAAELVNPNLKNRKRLLRILKSGEQPFSRFNPRSTFTTYSAMKLLCGGTATASTEWSRCSEIESPDTEELQGKVVVIGEYSACDVHESVLGKTYGVDLQANYLAALLADEVYVPVGTALSRTIYVTGWFVLVQLVFAFVRPQWRAALYCGFLWLSVFIGSLIALAYFGYLFTIWFQGLNLGVILLTWVEHWLHRLAKREASIRAQTLPE